MVSWRAPNSDRRVVDARSTSDDDIRARQLCGAGDRAFYALSPQFEEEGMARQRSLFRAGAVVWIVGGIGHFALIDLLTLHGRTWVAKLAPHADVLATMEATTLSFGALGSTTVF